MNVFRAVKRMGIVGINGRNLAYMIDRDYRSRFPLVDDKVRTKELCRALGIPVPKDYAVIARQGDVKGFPEVIGATADFVVKPARGAGGRGILVVTGRDGDRYCLADETRLEPDEVRFHLSTVLSGLYSLRADPDEAIIEKRVVTHRCFEALAVGGTPDIRVLVYRGIPIMAMIRLPTRASRGRANLHQGAVAAGIDLAMGRTFGGVWRNRIIASHPDTAVPLAGLLVPGWRDLLRFASQLADAIQLRYVGVDFAIDAAEGPVVLEANARPGLAIQIANRRGLSPRLEAVDAFPAAASMEDRIGLAVSLAAL